jgi:hypothetical protein
MFHLGDIVEEIATKRKGKLGNMRGPCGIPPRELWVFFSDGKDPLIWPFFKEEELRLVKRPHLEEG